MVGKIQFIQIVDGAFWVEIQELNLRILCACPPDIVKHLMLKGLVKEEEKQGQTVETGPNAILLSDIMLQNGQFSNMAEFPVLQMLYKQGMIIPNHPNNDGSKPMVIGSKEQIESQMEYIYRGNYGLVSYEEILDCVKDEKLASDLWRMKKRFAFGQIKKTEELLEAHYIENDALVLKDKLTIKRIDTNIFDFQYDGESVHVDLNLNRRMNYSAPYPLGFHDIKREYFSVVHSGQGDGFDVNRPSMSSILTFQGKVYIIDAGPNISYSLTTLGFGINEIEGIFQTHAHDDHFAGITTLLRSDHRIKFYAVPMVRKSVFLKLGALLKKSPDDFYDFFDVQDLKMDKWNDVNGMEVRPVMSPHPVETTIYFFQTFWGGNYTSYAHFADIASTKVLQGMVVNDEQENGISQQTYDKVINEYMAEVNLKKIDIGGGMIHGDAEDFAHDTSERIILAHTAQPLNTRQKEIGSSAPFGIVDVMIPEFTNNLHRRAYDYLRNYFVNSSNSQLEKILNNAIISYPPGSLIIKKQEKNGDVYLLLTGYVEKMRSDSNGMGYNLLSSGSFIGDYSGLRELESNATFRTVSYVQALQIPSRSYKEFVKKNRLFRKIEELRENLDYLEKHWLFRESIGTAILGRISEAMELKHHYQTDEEFDIDKEKLYVIKEGSLEVSSHHLPVHSLKAGDFFNYESVINESVPDSRIKISEPSSIFEINHQALQEIPIILWKLLESYNKVQLTTNQNT